ETDQMGVVYHANYLVWFEIGRTKYIEQLGFQYDQLEKEGYLSPVTDAQISYKFPVKYGDKIFVETWLEGYDKIRATYAYQVVEEMGRSEEHTSELQSRFDLVCRLLLEKKKK